MFLALKERLKYWKQFLKLLNVLAPVFYENKTKIFSSKI